MKAILIGSLALLAASVGAVVAGVLPFRAVPPPPPQAAAGRLPPAPKAPPRVELVVAPADASIRAGEEVEIRFSLKNAGTAATWVLPFLDGSGDGLRYPICVVEIRNAAGLRVDAPSFRMCGTYTPLDARHFVRLEPGASLSLGGGPRRFAGPDVYTVSMTYDSTPQEPQTWFRGRPADPEILRRLSEMPHVRLEAKARIDVLP
jgi:hypothetical protein